MREELQTRGRSIEWETAIRFLYTWTIQSLVASALNLTKTYCQMWRTRFRHADLANPFLTQQKQLRMGLSASLSCSSILLTNWSLSVLMRALYPSLDGVSKRIVIRPRCRTPVIHNASDAVMS